MFEDLSEKLEATFARLRGRGVLSEADIREGLREVRRELLEAMPPAIPVGLPVASLSGGQAPTWCSSTRASRFQSIPTGVA